MRKCALIVLCIITIMCNLVLAQESTPDFNSLIKSNVQILVGGGCGSGSVILVKGGYIYVLTARHVVDELFDVTEEGEDPIRVYVVMPLIGAGAHKIQIYSDNVVISEEIDLAIVRIQYYPIYDFAVRPLANRLPQIGDTVYTVGCPLGLVDYITKGIYSLYLEDNGIGSPRICFDCGIIYGNSGGAAVNSQGELIGVVVEVAAAGFYAVPHMGMAVPLAEIQKFLKSVKVI